MTMPKPVCAVHNMEMDLIPAGISKSGPRTGQPYPAFWRCKLRECSQKVQDAAWQLTQAPQPAQEPRSAPAVTSEPTGATLRLQVGIAALQAAGYGPGSPEDVLARATTYCRWLRAVAAGADPATALAAIIGALPVTPTEVP